MTRGRENKEYEPPYVVDHGSLKEMTAMMSDGENTDSIFPIGIPKGDITFS